MNADLNSPNQYTPEQRKLLGKAYRLILSWKREDPKRQLSSLDVAGNTNRKSIRTSPLAPSDTGQGEKNNV
jgi:hypothetical protein